MSQFFSTIDGVLDRVARARVAARQHLFVKVAVTPYCIARSEPEHGSDSVVVLLKVPLHGEHTRRMRFVLAPEARRRFTLARDRAPHVKMQVMIDELSHANVSTLTFQPSCLAAYDAASVHVPSAFPGDAGWSVALQRDTSGCIEWIELTHNSEANALLTEFMAHEAHAVRRAEYASLVRAETPVWS